MDALYGRSESGHTADNLADESTLPVPTLASEIHFDLVNSQVVRSDFDGFVQFVDNPALMNLAEELDSVIVLDIRPGDYVSKGSYLGWVLRTTHFVAWI